MVGHLQWSEIVHSTLNVRVNFSISFIILVRILIFMYLCIYVFRGFSSKFWTTGSQILEFHIHTLQHICVQYNKIRLIHAHPVRREILIYHSVLSNNIVWWWASMSWIDWCLIVQHTWLNWFSPKPKCCLINLRCCTRIRKLSITLHCTVRITREHNMTEQTKLNTVSNRTTTVCNITWIERVLQNVAVNSPMAATILTDCICVSQLSIACKLCHDERLG